VPGSVFVDDRLPPTPADWFPDRLAAAKRKKVVVAPYRTWGAVWLALPCVTSSCTSKPLRVRVVFDNGWTFGGQTPTDRERSLVKSIALQTLRNAYSGFGSGA
jgi:hypothetical protein